MRYFLDTCIWRDFYENRISKKGNKLGEIADKLFKKILSKENVILFSDSVVKELKRDYNKEEIDSMFNLLFIAKVLERVEITKEEYLEAKKISEDRNLPFIDVLNAIQSRNNNAILISQDDHFNQLRDIIKFKKPQEII